MYSRYLNLSVVSARITYFVSVISTIITFVETISQILILVKKVLLTWFYGVCVTSVHHTFQVSYPVSRKIVTGLKNTKAIHDGQNRTRCEADCTG